MPRLTTYGIHKAKPGKSRREIPDSGSPGLYLVIQTSGSKSWALRFRNPHGRHIKLTLGAVDLSDREADDVPTVIGQPLSLVAARGLAAELNTKRARGVDIAADFHRTKLEKAAGLSNTFDSQARDFVEQHLKRKIRRWRSVARLIGIAPDSEGQLQVIPKSLSDRWRDRPVSGITADDLQWVIDETRERGVPGLTRRGNRQSNAMAFQMYSALRKLCRWLLQKRRIKSDPCADLAAPESSGESRDRVLSNDEIKRFWRATGKINEPAQQALRLMLLTGARLNEIAMLSRSEIDGNIVTVPIERSKNKKAHAIPLSPIANKILSSIKTKGDRVFVSKSGKPIGPWSRIKNQLDEHMQPDKPFVIHDLRRTFATGCNELGIEPHIVEACLNHSGNHKAGIAGVYNRAAYLPEKTAALQRWSNHVTGLIEGRVSKLVNLKAVRAAS